MSFRGIPIEYIFKENKFVVEEAYCRQKINLSEDPLAIAKNIIVDILRVYPLEASSALMKLYHNDFKSFIDAHVDSHICGNLLSLCRERGPRIKLSIYDDGTNINVYSECFDVEILLSIVLGDISSIIYYESGYREGIRYKKAIIPKTIAMPLIVSTIDKLFKPIQLNIRSTIAIDVIKEIENNLNAIGELIILLPCIDNNTLSSIENLLRKAILNNKRIFLVIPSPTIYEAKKCGVDYKNYLVSYIELQELYGKKIFICNADTGTIGFIINRNLYISSYGYRYRDNLEMIPIKDQYYIENAALGYLRECLCSQHLIKEDLDYKNR